MSAPSLRMERSSLGTPSLHMYNRVKTKMCWLTSANTRFISENETLHYSMEPILYVCAIGLKQKCADSPLLMPASSLRMEHYSLGTPSLHMYNRVKTKMCWLTSADARLINKDGTLLDGTSSPHVYKRVKNRKSADSPLLMPASSLRMEHSSMGPKTWNICLISSSLSFFETIPTNSFRSKKRKKSKFFHFFPSNYLI